MRNILALVVPFLLLVGSCTSTTDTTVTSSATRTTDRLTTATLATIAPAPTTTVRSPTLTTVSSTTTTPTELPTSSGAFGATLEDVPLITTGTYPGPEWPDSLDGVAFVDAVPESLRDDLLQNGFVIEANTGEYPFPEALTWSSQFSSTYEQLSPYESRAVFVTTDAAYHLWHQVFDKVLRDTETNELLPALERFIENLVDASRQQAATSAGTAVGDATERAKEHMEAVATVLGLDVGPIGERAAAEVALVEEHSRLTASPTVGGECDPSCVDYSLMTPRGHYTRTEDLTRYFKGMSMLGNTMFLIGDPNTLRVGALIAGLITTDPENLADWEKVYHPTAFLVGTADDYTPIEISVAAATVVDTGLADPVALADDATMLAIGEELRTRRVVRVDPGKASMRTMGARFVLDSWIYDQLTDPGVPDRIRPTPLDLASVMGSDYAADVQDDAGVPDTFPGYELKVNELRTVAASRTVNDWGRTVYDGWLYTLEPLWVSQHLDAFPPFMRTVAWQAKSHNTGFSSYAELKHDTILYAKQGVAEGDAPVPPPPPRHWVEPDPVAFGRLSALATMMRDGLIEARLMISGGYDSEPGDPLTEAETTRRLIDTLIDFMDRLERIAQEELMGDEFGDEDDNIWLAHIGEEMSLFTQMIGKGELEPTPIIADVFLDPFADEVLEIGTGPLDTIHVLVPSDQGQFQIATGAVYSYYEFWGPRSNRLNDEEWWDVITAGDLPDRPTWWTDELD
jgi:hypothetical protein